MTNSGTCSQCGAALPASAPGQRCPKCLLRFAFDPETAEAGLPVEAPLPAVHYFGDYQLLEEIARGGMGVVWKARQVLLNRTVAVKLLLSGRFSSPEFVQRFRNEAQAAANLQHPNIVAIHEVGEHEGQQYFSMDYVDGPNLAQLVREQPLPARRSAAYLKKVSEAVHYAHQHGVIHRDLKPANVLIDANDQPRVTDFGLAKIVAQTESAGSPAATQQMGSLRSDELTLTGQILGTPGFVSPEQAGGKRGAVGPVSDVYSLGAVLYFLLTGRPPFAAGTWEETLRQVHEQEPLSPRLLNPSVPRDLETICLKCLSKEPARRYLSAQSLAEDLARFLSDEAIVSRPTQAPEKFWRWCRRKPALATLMLALLVVGTVGLAGILWQWRRATEQSHRAEQHATRETDQRVRAEEAVTLLELQRAEDLLEKDELVRGVAHLARMVRHQPGNPVAATRLISALTQRDFVLPVGAPLQHEQKVNYAEFSPDGRQVATASLDGTARVWDARTGLPVGEPLWHSNAVDRAHFSPDGRRLVTVSDSVEALLWDTATGGHIGQPMRHEKDVRSAQFSSDGRKIVTASGDQTARLWDARTGEPLLAPLRHAGPVRHARFSPNSQWIVTISGNAAFLWDAESGRPVGTPVSHGTTANIDGVKLLTAQFSPDSQYIVTTSDAGNGRVWEVATGKPITDHLVHRDKVVWAEFSPDGRRVVTAADDGAARVWDARTGEQLTKPLLHGGLMVSAGFSPEGQRLLTVFADNSVRLREACTDRLLAAPFQHEGFGARFSPDGQFVVTASFAAARIWDIRPGHASDITVAHSNAIHSVHFSPDGQWLATSARDFTARVWDSHTGRPRTPPLSHTGGTYPAPFSQDGQRLLTAGWDGTARLWDARTGQLLCEPLRHDSKVVDAEFSPDGKWFLTLCESTGIRLWNAHTGEFHCELVRQGHVVFAHFSPDSQSVGFGRSDDNSAWIVDIHSKQTRVVLRGHDEFFNNMYFSSDARRVVTASQDGTARICDAATGAPLTPPLSHKAAIYSARFSPDGLLVVTASADATARIWDAQTGRALTEPLRHLGPVWEAVFGPDGQTVLTSSLDATVRLWDSRTGRPLADPIRQADIVWRSAFSPDGLRIASASRDGTSRIWELPPKLSSADWQSSAAPTGSQPATQRMATLRYTEALLLARLAEAVIGQRLSEEGTLEPVSSAHLMELRREFSGHSATNAFNRWLTWFLADRSTRTISPNSPITVPEYIARLIEQRTLSAAREAVLLGSSHAPALAHLAEMLLSSPGSDAPVVQAEATFLQRRAKTLAPPP